jgi:4-coumarate--CoA ligase
VPPLVSFLATHPKVSPQLLSSVHSVTGGAAPFGPALIERFMQKASPHVIKFREGFGMTESSPVSHVQPEENAILGGCGVPVPNTIAKIVHLDTGKALPAGEEGELCVSGPQVMKGYHKNKKATDSTIIKGWLHTGDIARYDETSQFFIVDRLKELIKVKGLQVNKSPPYLWYSPGYSYQ